MFKDVAMPKVASRIAVERHNNARHRLRRALHNILPSHLMRCWRKHRPSKLQRFIRKIVERRKALTVQYLEPHHVQMNRMRILRKIHEAPYLGAIELHKLRHRIYPVFAIQ